MRLWSLHPSYLDGKGLVALWREGLLARAVLNGQTKGYLNHPQLARLKEAGDPLMAIDAYLEEVIEEAKRRNYSFDATKIIPGYTVPKISVTEGQLEYELTHLRAKLEKRSPNELSRLPAEGKKTNTHPLFKAIPGFIEPWEKV
jgi:hypothetical protein